MAVWFINIAFVRLDVFKLVFHDHFFRCAYSLMPFLHSCTYYEILFMETYPRTPWGIFVMFFFVLFALFASLQRYTQTHICINFFKFFFPNLGCSIHKLHVEQDDDVIFCTTSRHNSFVIPSFKKFERWKCRLARTALSSERIRNTLLNGQVRWISACRLRMCVDAISSKEYKHYFTFMWILWIREIPCSDSFASHHWGLCVLHV